MNKIYYYIFLTAFILSFSTSITYAQELLSAQAINKKKDYIYWEEAITNQDSVYRLSLWNEGLEMLPEEIYLLKRLQWANFFDNQLNELPQGFAELQNLERLNFSHNKFEILPVEILELHNLKQLDFHKNQLKSIPKEISNLENLEILDLHENQIQSLPKSIKKLKNLKRLNLKENPISVEEKDRIKKALPNTEIYFSE